MGWVLRIEIGGRASSGYMYILTGDQKPTDGLVKYMKQRLAREGWEVVAVDAYKVGTR